MKRLVIFLSLLSLIFPTVGMATTLPGYNGDNDLLNAAKKQQIEISGAIVATDELIKQADQKKVALPLIAAAD